MNIRVEKYECATVKEGIDWMQERAGKEVSRCVFPTRPSMDYYITRCGELFAMKHFHKAGKYVVHQCPPFDASKARGVFYRLYAPTGCVMKNAARLIFCTFILGYWSDNTKVIFKDGDPYHINLENLEERKITLTEDNASNMEMLTDVYRKEFNSIAHLIAYMYTISEDEAKDIVQDSFLILSQNRVDESKMPFFLNRWKSMAIKRGQKVLANVEVHADFNHIISYHISPPRARMSISWR